MNATNFEHIEVLRGGADAVAAWIKEHPGQRMNLRAANLQGVNLD
ncbi:MAG: hypothetical protein RLZZ303_175, partial [Candidatus Hydrogenedentota bacterium]